MDVPFAHLILTFCFYVLWEHLTLHWCSVWLKYCTSRTTLKASKGVEAPRFVAIHMAEEFSGIDVAASVTILTTLPVAF